MSNEKDIRTIFLDWRQTPVGEDVYAFVRGIWPFSPERGRPHWIRKTFSKELLEQYDRKILEEGRLSPAEENVVMSHIEAHRRQKQTMRFTVEFEVDTTVYRDMKEKVWITSNELMEMAEAIERKALDAVSTIGSLDQPGTMTSLRWVGKPFHGMTQWCGLYNKEASR